MKRTRKPTAVEIEVQPDAWERFEKAVDAVMRSPPKHRAAKKNREPSPAPRGKRGGPKPAYIPT